MNTIQKLSRDLSRARTRLIKPARREAHRDPADWLSQLGDVARRLPPRGALRRS